MRVDAHIYLDGPLFYLDVDWATVNPRTDSYDVIFRWTSGWPTAVRTGPDIRKGPGRRNGEGGKLEHQSHDVIRRGLCTGTE